MRTLAIGDIHGCSAAFDALLAVVDLQAGDVLVTLGDYVDRGPDTKGVIDRLIELQGTRDLISLIGNHDQMMLDVRTGEPEKQWWLDDYGKGTLASYGGSLHDVPDAHWRFLESCRDYYETATHFFVHANAYPDVDLEDQPVFMMRWESLQAATSSPHKSGKTMVCGHTSQKSGRPLDLGHAVCIDTYPHRGGWLTCLDVTSRRVWQANQAGESQAAWLDELS